MYETDDDPAKSYDAALKALSNVDRVKAIEGLHRFDSLSKSLRQYLATLPPGSVVKKEDIDSFFASLLPG